MDVRCTRQNEDGNERRLLAKPKLVERTGNFFHREESADEFSAKNLEGTMVFGFTASHELIRIE